MEVAHRAVAALEARIEVLETKLVYLEVDDTSTFEGLAPPHVIFRGVNLHVQNGLAQTNTNNGLGNLIVGYNEAITADSTMRIGSYNLIIGIDHRYTSYGGFVAGYQNRIAGQYATVSGGYHSLASGDYSSVSAGEGNIASGQYSSVSGGYNRSALGIYDWVGGSLSEDQ